MKTNNLNGVEKGYRIVKVTNNKTGLSFKYLASDEEVWECLGLVDRLKKAKSKEKE